MNDWTVSKKSRKFVFPFAKGRSRMAKKMRISLTRCVPENWLLLLASERHRSGFRVHLSELYRSDSLISRSRRPVHTLLRCSYGFLKFFIRQAFIYSVFFNFQNLTYYVKRRYKFYCYAVRIRACQTEVYNFAKNLRRWLKIFTNFNYIVILPY